jgi:hypothetical protein
MACNIVKSKYFAVAAWVALTALSCAVSSQNPHVRYRQPETKPLDHVNTL